MSDNMSDNMIFQDNLENYSPCAARMAGVGARTRLPVIKLNVIAEKSQKWPNQQTMIGLK